MHIQTFVDLDVKIYPTEIQKAPRALDIKLPRGSYKLVERPNPIIRGVTWLCVENTNMGAGYGFWIDCIRKGIILENPTFKRQLLFRLGKIAIIARKKCALL